MTILELEQQWQDTTWKLAAIGMPTALCGELHVALWAVGCVAVFGRQQRHRLTADGSRFIRKHRLVKQSTPVVALQHIVASNIVYIIPPTE